MLSIVVAIGDNFAIGKNGGLVRNFKKDMKRFKDITTGKVVIMGRKTFETLPSPLSNRQHIVITKNKEYKINHDRVEIVNNIKNIFEFKDKKDEYFVIGGEEVYKIFLPYCNKIYLTQYHEKPEADTFFPYIDFSEWNIFVEEKGNINTEESISYTFSILTRKSL